MVGTIFFVGDDKFKMTVEQTGLTYVCTLYVYMTTIVNFQMKKTDWVNYGRFYTDVPTLSLNKEIFLNSLLLSE
jgi:hypothetical protein